MEKRRFGRTEHMSTVAILGAFAFSEATQDETDEAMEMIIEAGVNHIDVAPTYGEAEERLGPWLARERDRFFVGGKTMERTRDGAAREMRASLERLQIERFDLYQLHAVNSMEELTEATGPNGALQAVLEAREAGLTRFVGITGHGLEAPTVFVEALSRFDFDSVLFPINFVLYGNADYRRRSEELMRQCRSRDVGTMAIKSIAKGLWDDDESRVYNTWYKPFDEADRIQQAVDFALSQNVTGLCTAGDLQLLPLFLEACEAFTPMEERKQNALMATADAYEPIFV
jgi:aryl-alcohol dehydrogenase-like predicted oxidoreductase